MWKLYDDLYIGIPSGLRIESCTIGKNWTTVRANGNVGIAKTLEQIDNPLEFAASFKGAWLRETANHMVWDSLTRASVGVAAMNAWYNTQARAEGLGANFEHKPLTGKIAYVGDYEGADAFPLPMSPDFDPAEYEKLRSYDTVVLCACALITRALPKLLDIIGEDGKVVLNGYSVPCSALFFAFDMPVCALRGYYPECLDSFESRAIKEIPAPAGAVPFTICRDTVKKIVEKAKSRS